LSVINFLRAWGMKTQNMNDIKPPAFYHAQKMCGIIFSANDRMVTILKIKKTIL
jgi:hypothetical protein